MSQAESLDLSLIEAERALTAVIDIGSNSVRMVVYQGSGRVPVPVFNERTLCGLGRRLGRTGRLDPEGVESALRHLERFAALGEAMGVARWEVLATEAVRSAEDGAGFVAEVERRLDAPVHILDGDLEAEASALGVVSGTRGADGMMGDLGGGSLEIVALDAGVPGRRATLPLGSLRLGAQAGKSLDAAARIADGAFAEVDWLGAVAGRTFYPVGGAWRAFANVHMGHHGYPLHVIHGYALDRDDALELLALVMRQSPRSLGRIPGVPKARLATLPAAAMVMERLLRAARPLRVVFSAQGLREGWLYRQLSERERALDPLLAGCAEYAAHASRFGVPGDELAQWIAPLFSDETAEQRRLRRAAALLSDTGWRHHPDYRADDTFLRVLHLPLTGLDHAGRAALAFAVSARYGGGPAGGARDAVRALVDGGTLDWAIRVGRALRVAQTLSGGTRDVLLASRLRMGEKVITLELPKGAGYLMSDVAGRRFKAMARAFGRKTCVRD